MITITDKVKEPITVRELCHLLKDLPLDAEVYFENVNTIDAIQYAFLDDDGDLVFYNNESDHELDDEDYVKEELVK